jgi:V-type H+-transporting ATPase subunit a
LNDFTLAFHEIVATYGTPNYKEVNPTVVNIITFPFLFGVMFGDLGHGAILLYCGAYLCIKSDKIKHKLVVPFLKIRYMLLLMGLFATFCGFIYNDMMSLPLNLFGSCYEETTVTTRGTGIMRHIAE